MASLLLLDHSRALGDVGLHLLQLGIDLLVTLAAHPLGGCPQLSLALLQPLRLLSRTVRLRRQLCSRNSQPSA